MKNLLLFFQKNGIERKVKKGEEISLEDRDKIFYGEAVTLFFIEASGTRHFVGHLRGPIFFPIPLQAVAEKGGSFYEAPLSAFAAFISTDQAAQAELAVCLQDWTETLSQITCQALPTIETLTLIQQGLWIKRLEEFSVFFRDYLPKKLEELQQVESRILKGRVMEQELNLKTAFEQMEAIFDKPHAALHKTRQNALEEACQHIGQKMGLSFIFPHAALSHTRIEDQLEVICATSQVRKRRVRLRPKWWQNNGGHFLGFLEGRPIALLNQISFHYYLFDGRKRMLVTQKLAEQIAKNAYSFYRPLPEKAAEGKRVLGFLLKICKKQLIYTALFSVLAGIIAFFPALATRLLFFYAVPQSSPALVLYLSLGLVYAALGYALFFALRTYYFLRFEGAGIHLILSGVWDRLLKLSPHFFRSFSSGNLYYRASISEEIRKLISGNNASICLAGIFSILYLLVMFIFSPLLTLACVAVTALAFITLFICGYQKVKILRQSLEVQGGLRSLLIQTLSGVGKLRVAGAEKNAFAHWAMIYTKYKFLQMKVQNLENVVTALSAFLPLLSMWAVYALIIGSSSGHALTISNFLAFNIAFGSYIASIYPFVTILIQLTNIVPLWERGLVILQEPLEEERWKGQPGRLSGEVFLDSVVFGYDTNLPPVINRLSLVVKPHQMIGIVGPSGAGKSTLLRLILGFEKPLSGGVYFDGKDLASLDPQAVRRQIGTVMQGADLLAGTIYDNLVCGGSYPPKQIEKALELSGFAADLADLPMGLMTYVPMNGATLSGGQKQRLLLSRALLINPSILIFDEATSALDNTTQKVITRHLDSLNTTRIIVAQRLSTIRHADQIYVLQNGSVVQTGSFDALAKTPGIFAEMLIRQTL